MTSPSETMQALVRTDRGAALVRRARPRLPPDPGWVRVRLSVAGLCRTDAYAARGELPCAPATVLGHEAAGVIEALSPGTTLPPALADALAARTLVAFRPYVGCGGCAACRDARAHHCGGARMLGVDRDGVFAEEVVVPASACVPLPGVHDPRVAAFLEPLAAALSVTRADLPRDARVWVLGEGRVARLAQQVLRGAGYLHVDCGACPPSGDVYDAGVATCADPDALDGLASALRPGGTLVLKSRPAGRVLTSVGLWAMRDLTVRAVSYGSFDDAAAQLASGALDVSPWIGPLHSFEEFHELLLHEGGDASERAGKPMLACDPTSCAA